MELQVLIRPGKKHNLVRNMILFYMHHVGIQNSRYNLNVVTREGMQKDTGGWGATTHTDKDIIICIDSKLPLTTMMSTLAHEMVHAKQIATGLLKLETKRGRHYTYWKGNLYHSKDYLSDPWEVLAFAKQEIMALRLYNFMVKMVSELK